MRHVTISGTYGGPIWMPMAVCSKYFKVSSQDYSAGDTLRDIVLRLTGDGDFRSAVIADATVTFTRSRRTATGVVSRVRHMDIRQFPSVADCVVEFDSERYWEIVDAGQEGDDDEET